MAETILPQTNKSELNDDDVADALADAVLAEMTRPGPGRSVVTLAAGTPPVGELRLDARQALVIGARACEHLLTGQPHESTFEPIDLELALVLLRQMAATVRPAPEPAGRIWAAQVATGGRA